ncbi:MAG TPA: DNA-binding response regulator [Acidimicrobiia bacterium]
MSDSAEVVALVADLMDRSRVSAALPGVRFTSDPTGCAGAEIVVVDLARHGTAVAAVRAAAPAARIVAFGPHVDEALLSAARDDGADVVLPRSQFFRDPAAAVARAT